MTICLRVGAVATWIVLIGAGARAQDHERFIDTRSGLSLDDAIAGALEREPALRAARAGLDAARGMRLQAGLRPNPTFSLERREEPAGSDNQTMVGVELPLDLFRRPARISVADLELEATERSIADRVRALVGEVRMRYGQTAAAVRDVASTDDLVASARRSFELLRQRVEQGASPPLQRDMLEVELRRFEADRLMAASRADAAMFELKRALGFPADRQVRLRDTLETLAPPAAPEVEPPAAPMDRSVASERPDVREAEARVRLAESRVEQARSEGRMDVSLFGSYQRMNAGFSQRGFNPAGDLERVQGVFHYFSGGAMMTVPLRNRNQGAVAAAQAERIAAAARLEAAELAAQAEIAAATAQDLQTRRARAFIEGSVRLARQNLEVMRQTYELGRAPLSDVLNEQRRYLEVENAYTAVLRSAYEARTALQLARGELP